MLARLPETPASVSGDPVESPLARKAQKVHRLRVRQSLLGRMRLQMKPVKK